MKMFIGLWAIAGGFIVTMPQVVIGEETSKTAVSAPKPAPPSHWESRVSEIRESLKSIPAETSQTLVFLGDSITEQYATRYYLPKTIYGMYVVNEGIGGDIIESTLGNKSGFNNRLDLVKDAKPRAILVLGGINDINIGRSVEQIKASYEKLLDSLRRENPDALIVVQSILPVREREKAREMNSKAVDINKVLPEIAKKFNGEFLDLNSLMKNDEGELNLDYSGDGVHLNGRGYAVWHNAFEKKLQEIFQKDR